MSENVYPAALGTGWVVPGPSRAGTHLYPPSHTVEDFSRRPDAAAAAAVVSEGLLGPC